MDRLTRLRNVPLFASLSTEALKAVADLATVCSHAKGSFLCTQGDPGRALYVVVSGEAVIHQRNHHGARRPVGYLRTGDHFGEESLLLGNPCTASVQATTDVEAMCIHKHDLDRLREDHPEIRDQLTTSQRPRGRLPSIMTPGRNGPEDAVLLRKRHWVVFLRTLFTPLLTMLGLLLVVWLLRWLNVIPSPLVSFLFIGAAPAAMVLWSFMDWQNDYYLLTTTWVIHREKALLSSDSLDGIPLSRVQGTNITRGAIGRVLGFGTLEIYVASAKGSIVFDYLPDPESMRDSIAKQIALLNAQSQQRDQEIIRHELLRPKHRDPSRLYEKQPTSGRSVLPSQRLGKQPSDQIDRMIWRKHWAYLVKGVLLPLPLTAILTALIATNVSRWATRDHPYLLPGSLVLWTASAFWLWWQVGDWRNDIYVLTDRLIIDVERKPLSLSDDRTQATLDMIQNVSLRIPGPLAALLDYGDLVIETAGPTGVFTFDGVSHPAAVQREIFRRVEAYDETERRLEREQRIDEFSEWFHIYGELSQQQPPDRT